MRGLSADDDCRLGATLVQALAGEAVLADLVASARAALDRATAVSLMISLPSISVSVRLRDLGADMLLHSSKLSPVVHSRRRSQEWPLADVLQPQAQGGRHLTLSSLLKVLMAVKQPLMLRDL